MNASPSRPALRTAIVWGALLMAVVTAGLVTSDEAFRRGGLRAVLLFMAAGEGAGAFANIFLARRMAEPTGRPYHPAHHGVRQDFGFYNLAMMVLLVLCAVDPD